MNILEKFEIDWEKVLRSLRKPNGSLFFGPKDIIVRKQGREVSVKCPFHDDKSPSLGISFEKNAYNCFVCKERIGESKFIQSNESIGKGTFIPHFLKNFFGEIYWRHTSPEEIAEVCQISQDKKTLFYSWIREKKAKGTYKNKISPQEIIKYPLNILTEFSNWDYSYIKNRLTSQGDISEERFIETIRFFFIWVCQKTGDVTIPIFQEGYLKGVYARARDEKRTKYYSVKAFKRTSLIFNIDDIPQDCDEVILVEGPLNTIRLWSLGYENVISLFWASPYLEQLEKLKRFRKIKVWFDGDKAGDEGRKVLSNKLPTIQLSFIRTPEKKDAYDYNKQEIDSLLTQ